MNIQLHHAVSDITGKTGMLIVRAIANGEHDPEKLAQHRDGRCKATEETLADALREEPKFDVRAPLHRITGGVDLTQIPGIASLSALQLFAEIGPDMSRWPSQKHFASWASVAPGTKITGGKVISSRRRSTKSRVGTILRQAVVNVGRTDTAHGAFYRRISARAGKGKAVVATARKTACVVYNLLKHGGEFREIGREEYDKRYRSRRIRTIRKQAKKLGYELIVAEHDQGVT